MQNGENLIGIGVVPLAVLHRLLPQVNSVHYNANTP